MVAPAALLLQTWAMRRALLLAVLGAALAATGASAAGAAAPEDEIGSALQALQSTQDRGGDVAQRAQDAQLDVTPGERVMVDVYVNGDPDAAADRLRAGGMQVLATGTEPLPVVEGRVPIAQLDDVSATRAVRAVQPVESGGTDAWPGTKGTEGDTAHRGSLARALGGGSVLLKGAGVKVGIISDSIDQIPSTGTGITASGTDLPSGRVQVLQDDTTSVIDEGRAMAEVVYDEVPGVDKLIFASGTWSGAAGKATSINNLVAAGVDVIADDIFYLSEPMFQDGQVAQAVDAARAAGVTYFASAGNRARQSWEGTYTDSGGAENFGGGDTIQTIATVPNGKFIQLTLQWNEPWGAATTDIDARFVTTGGALLSGQTGGTDANITSGLPRETVGWTNSTGAAVTVALRIPRFAGTGTPFMKYIARGDFGAFSIAEYPTNSDTINPDAASATGAITVGAVAADDVGLDTPESFSSRGPKTRLRDKNGVALASPLVLQKPQIAAADKITTTVPSPLATFSGTSAAAPSAAGIAALMLSERPSLTPDQVEAILSDSSRATDCLPLGIRPDDECGAGFVYADAAVIAARDTSPPTVDFAVGGPLGLDGWRTGDASVTWQVTDPESVITSRAGCGPVTVSTDTAGTAIDCAPASIGGPTSGRVVIRRDTAPPAPPTITGIGAGPFTATSIPPGAAIGCTSTDATSGVSGCSVAGYSIELGQHTLTATATDNAGLRSTSTLTYTVVLPPPTIGSFTGPKSARSGKSVTFTLGLDLGATVSFAVERQETGRKVKGACVKQTRKNRKAKSCKRYVTVGSFTSTLAAGSAKAKFSGKVKGRKLPAGTYRLTATPTGVGGTGAPRSRTLTVTR